MKLKLLILKQETISVVGNISELHMVRKMFLNLGDSGRDRALDLIEFQE